MSRGTVSLPTTAWGHIVNFWTMKPLGRDCGSDLGLRVELFNLSRNAPPSSDTRNTCDFPGMVGGWAGVRNWKEIKERIQNFDNISCGEAGNTSLFDVVKAFGREERVGHEIEPGKATQQHDKLIGRDLPAQLPSLMTQRIHEGGPVVALGQLIYQTCHLSTLFYWRLMLVRIVVSVNNCHMVSRCMLGRIGHVAAYDLSVLGVCRGTFSLVDCKSVDSNENKS